jgi:hypothetical protein
MKTAPGCLSDARRLVEVGRSCQVHLTSGLLCAAERKSATGASRISQTSRILVSKTLQREAELVRLHAASSVSTMKSAISGNHLLLDEHREIRHSSYSFDQ